MEDEKKEEQVAPETKSEEKKVNPYEEAARNKGWRPKEEFEGDESTWVGAEEFLKREPLFDRIKKQTSELKELKKTIDAMAVHYKKNVEAEVAKRISDLKSQRREAIQVGDVDKVEEIDKAIDEQKQIKEDTPTKQEINPEIASWVSKNTWFDSEPECQEFAIAYSKLQMEKGKSLTDSLEATEKAVKKAFPEKFTKNLERQKAPPAVESPAQVKTTDKHSTSRLNKEQRLVYDQMVTRYKVVTHDEFMKSLEEQGELQ